MTTRLSRAGASLAAVGLLIGMLAACTPQADPTKSPRPLPTKTAIFESDEEAFTAAEKTYRAYNEAENAQRRGDKDADPDQYLTGQSLEQTIKDRRELEELGYRLQGDVQVVEIVRELGSVAEDRQQLTLMVCADLTTSHVVLENGEKANLPDRPDLIASRAEMTWVADEFLISYQSQGDVSLCPSD